MTHVRTLAAFALVVAAIAGLAALLTSGTPASAAQAPAAVTVEAAAPVTPAELPSGAYTADEAFLADLLGPDTDTTDAHAALLIEQARRYCDLVVDGQAAPGAEASTRQGWLDSLTVAGPGALTLDEAGKLLDTAEAAYCPARV